MRERETSSFEARERKRQRLLEEAARKNRQIDYELEKQKTNKGKSKKKQNKPIKSKEIDYINIDRNGEKNSKKKSSAKDNKSKGRVSSNSKQEVRLKEKFNKERKLNQKSENRQFAGIMYSFVFLFLAMMGYLVYFQVALSPTIINSPYNKRQDILASQVVRGNIEDSQGNVLARTQVAEDGTEERLYPMGEMYAHMVGYDVMGKSGIELWNNLNLLTSNSFFVEKIKNGIQENKNQGDNVITTLDTNLQKVAYDALGSYDGVVMVMEVKTGRVLASVSKPSFDPTFTKKSWNDISNSGESVLLNRATQGLYIPGSIFKIVTLLDYIRTDSNYRDFEYNCTGYVEYGDTKIHCNNKVKHGRQNLEQAFANSCNGAFIEIGMSLDISSYQQTASDLLFNNSLPGAFAAKKSSFVLGESDAIDKLMMTSMGQGDTQVTPYHMLLLAAAIGNGGTLMEPYVVDSIVNNTGSIVKTNTPTTYGEIITKNEANLLNTYMESVVDYGTAKSLNTSSYEVAGKTGTAEFSSTKNETHSWFMGYASNGTNESKDIAISVVVEKSNGGLAAYSIGKKIFDAYY